VEKYLNILMTVDADSASEYCTMHIFYYVISLWHFYYQRKLCTFCRRVLKKRRKQKK